MKKRAFGPFLQAGAAVGVGALAARALWIEPRSLVLRRIDVEVPGWAHDGLKVGVVSDLHTGAPHVGLERVAQVAELIGGEAPDVVVLLGDYVDPRVAFASEVAPEAVADILGTIPAPLGIVAVLGNHDWGEGGDRIAAALRAAAITVLEDLALELGNGLWVVGLADATMRRPDTQRAYARVPDGAAPLVLSHDPDLFPVLPWRPQLVLSGHTHGGQVALPGISGRRWTPSRFGDRYTGGGVQVEGDKRLWVSRGVGTSRLPVRFRARPEVAVLTVRASEG